ncbi:hypothetical protein RMSM_04000 [Rhodopirellula maiorica SM1]|uniref:Uncharacterized protein n=1 Tax=Rhodopirellula maiorica SM1 TaxID=1265738 RepID=M5RIE2_9BACT|nr:hypothetical protein RMSM_04000 [Rhodopirellula maiorica SM1]
MDATRKVDRRTDVFHRLVGNAVVASICIRSLIVVDSRWSI